MNGLSLILKLFAKMCSAIYRKLGINGLLALVILIAAPASLIHLQNTETDYKYSYSYTVTPVTEPQKVDKKDVPPSIDRFADNYYTVTLQIRNCYSREMYYLPSLYADENDNYVSLRDYDYYSDIEDYDVISPQTCIPAGASVTLPYYFSGYDLSGTTLTFKPFDKKEADSGNTFSLDVP